MSTAVIWYDSSARRSTTSLIAEAARLAPGAIAKSKHLHVDRGIGESTTRVELIDGSTYIASWSKSRSRCGSEFVLRSLLPIP